MERTPENLIAKHAPGQPRVRDVVDGIEAAPPTLSPAEVQANRDFMDRIRGILTPRRRRVL